MMDDLHITKELLVAVHEGRRTPTFLHDLALGHLFELCPVCKEEFDLWREEADCEAPASHVEAIARALAAVERETPKLREEWCQAETRVAELLALPAHERLGRIEETPNLFRGPAFGELLIHESYRQMPGKPREALALAQLAKTILQHSEPTEYVVELYARAIAHVANAHRVLGHLLHAAELFDSARFLLRSQGAGDRATRAEIDHLEGSLKRAQRKFTDSERLFTRAVNAYRLAGSRPETARVLLNLSLLFYETGQAERGISAAEEAIGRLDPASEPQLLLYARHNRALCLCEAGFYEEAAAEVVATSADFAAQGDELSRLRVEWLRGKIARGVGDLGLAKRLFVAARRGFAERRMPYLVALVGLELADIALMEGRTAEVKTLAGELVRVFEREEVHREALAALILFRDAAELERVNAALVRSLTTYLAQAQHDPALAFQVAS